MEPPPPTEPSQPRLAWWHIALATAGVLLVFASPFPFVWGKSDAPSEYGALLQGVASTVALGLLLVTLHLQRHDLHLQRRELELSRDELQKNTEEQKGQREQMALQLEEMKRQNDLMRQEAELRIRPMLKIRASTFENFNIDVPNKGYGKAIVWRTLLRQQDQEPTEDIVSVLSASIQRHGLAHRLTHPVHAPKRTPLDLDLGESLPLLQIILPVQILRGSEVDQMRGLLDELRRFTVDVEYTDCMNRQPQILNIPFAPILDETKVPGP